MRERNLKNILKFLLLPMGFSLTGCLGNNLRPVRINTTPTYIYPEDENIDPALTIKQQIVKKNAINANNTAPITVNAPISNTKKIPVYNKPTNTQPYQTQQPYTPYYQYLASTTPTNTAEDIILEETVYIPSALASTPIDEIEVMSDAEPQDIGPAPQSLPSSIEELQPLPTTKNNNENIVLEETNTPKKEPTTTKKIENKSAPEQEKAPTTTTGQSNTPTAKNPTQPAIEPEQKTEGKKILVKTGDTLYSIASANNIKVYDLAEYNKISAPFTLKPGQTIILPPNNEITKNPDVSPKQTKSQTKTSAPEIISNINDKKTFIEEPKHDFVIVKKGDTIYSIARANNVPLKDVILRNNLQAPYTLSIGSKIYIPNSAFHIVHTGDTVYSISRKYNVNLNSLVKLNKIAEPYTLSIGQKILLPATNVDVEKKQIEYVVKDKTSTKIVNTAPSTNTPKTKQITQVRVAKKEKIQPKETAPQQTQIAQTQVQPQQTTKTTTPAPKDSTKKQTQQTTKTTVPVVASTPTPKQTTQISAETKRKKEQIERIIAKPAPLSSKRFNWPTKGKVISEFGIKNGGKRNDGINISALQGSPVVSAENGIVAYAGNELKGLGNLIIIKHDKDYMTIYAHNDNILVKKGDIVRRGTKIATVGKTGRVSTPQLHFEVRKKTKSINPRDILE